MAWLAQLRCSTKERPEEADRTACSRRTSMSHGAVDLSKGRTVILPHLLVLPAACRSPSLVLVTSEAPSPSASSAGQEVTRPPPGIGRGVWELPPAGFYAAGAGLLVVASLYGAYRSGRWPKRRRQTPP